MGLYDSVYIYMACPYCDKYQTLIGQTKDLDPGLNEYKEGDSILKVFRDLKDIDCIFECHSIECQFYADRRDILSQGTPSGFGRLFDAKVQIHECRITGNVYHIEKDKQLTDDELDKYKNKDPIRFNQLMKKYKHEPIACRNWNRLK